MNPTSLLEVNNLSVQFGAKAVVKGISFSIQPGEKLALVGESGSGKTITALSLLGLVADAKIGGEALFNQRNLLSLSERDLRAVRGQDIAMIFQEPMTALNPLFTVGNQIAEVLQIKQGLSPAQSMQSAIELIASTGITEPARRAASYPHQLSGGQRQRAMIAMALACKPKLLLADEPTTALDVSLRRGILALLSDLQRQHNMAVLLITHDLNLVRHFAQRVVVMAQGHIVEQGLVSEVFAQPQHPYTQKLLDSRPRRDVVEMEASAATPSASVLSGKALRVSYPVPIAGWRGWFRKGEFVAVKAANFALQRGQTLGVIGESGSGKSTLALAALGLVPSTGGLWVGAQAWGADKVGNTAQNKALRRRLQVVFQDPFSSLSPRMTVGEIVGEGLRVHAPTLTASDRQTRVVQALQEVGLDEASFPGLLQRYPHEFSGGQRQRLAIARALIIEPEVLVLDEPTSALDVTIQQQVLQLLQRLQRERALSYLFITHDVDVIRAMAHHVIVMHNGEIVEAGPVAQIMAEPQHPYTQRLLQAD
jgi:microcin C transport system ATP-binding protein